MTARPWLYDAPFAFGWASTGAILGVIFGWWALLVIFGLAVFIVVAPIRYRGNDGTLNCVLCHRAFPSRQFAHHECPYAD